MAYYIPTDTFDDLGDAAVPLSRFTHRHRHSKTQLRPRDLTPLGEEGRIRVLQSHCSRRGKRHDFVVNTRAGAKCLWCGILQPKQKEEEVQWTAEMLPAPGSK